MPINWLGEYVKDPPELDTLHYQMEQRRMLARYNSAINAQWATDGYLDEFLLSADGRYTPVYVDDAELVLIFTGKHRRPPRHRVRELRREHEDALRAGDLRVV